MYGRNNIFSRDSNGGSSSHGNNNSSSSNNYFSSYGNNYSNNQYGSNRYDNNKLGSYRLDYRYEEPPSYITSLVSIWKEIPPSTIVSKEETLHMTITELRIEDYYMIRKKQLKSTHEDRIKDAFRKDCFN